MNIYKEIKKTINLDNSSNQLLIDYSKINLHLSIVTALSKIKIFKQDTIFRQLVKIDLKVSIIF